MKKDNWGVHQTHCCFKHGCKYGYNIMQKECPVYAGKIKQEYPCESCDNDNSVKLFFGCYIELSEPIITDIQTKKSQKKWCPNEDCPVDKKYGLDVKFSLCPYCGSNIDFKDIVKSQKYPTETNLGLIDKWEVVEIREYPSVKKHYFFKEDLKSSDSLLTFQPDITVVDCLNIDFDQLKEDDEKSKIFISMYENKHSEVITLLKKKFSNVNVKFGLILFPTKYFREYDY